jgi:hypothetical protein
MKKCFVIMPISDQPGYEPGHFERVFEHIIQPACEQAGFKALRADDVQTTNFIALNVIKQILECEMAICDLSSRNPNVLYELGIRQAFNLPVTLIKDKLTERIFDIQGIRDYEYNSSLRVDLVEESIPDIVEIIKNTYESRDKEINSLVSLLGIEPAKIEDKKKISIDTELILNALNTLDSRMTSFESKHLISTLGGASTLTTPSPKILPVSLLGNHFSLEEIKLLKFGDWIHHDSYGLGTIRSVLSVRNDRIVASVKFNHRITNIAITIGNASIRKYNPEASKTQTNN